METRYCLKDVELQEQLDKLIDGDGFEFTEALQRWKELERTETGFVNFKLYCRKSSNGRCPVFTIELHESEIAEVSYDPKSWNVFPYVIPPLNVPMRVELFGGEYTCAMYVKSPDSEEYWWSYVFSGRPDSVIEYEYLYCMRFRPWEDYEEKYE